MFLPQSFRDSSIKFELSFVNMATDSTEDLKRDFRIPYQKDGFVMFVRSILRCCASSLPKATNGLTKTKFITFGVEGESMAGQKPRLDHSERSAEQLPPAGGAGQSR